MSIRLAGSLWSIPVPDRERVAARLASEGLLRWHWDVSDGVFAAPGGFDPTEAARIGAATGLPGEAHLMVVDPLQHVAPWAEICDTVVVHAEATGWRAAVEAIVAAGRQAAVAIAPGTPTEVVAGLPAGVGVLVMSVEPGRAAEPFAPETYQRLDRLSGRRLLGVDGSVDLERGLACVRHRATWLVSGSALTAADDPHRWIARITTADE